MEALKFWLMKEVAGVVTFLAVSLAILAMFGLAYAYAAWQDWRADRRRKAAKQEEHDG